ncbi:MAG: septation protein SpoVG family protein [Elusimicrobia bacterium]|nr:septation protein SpoVG family protein [Elusimicrobiota bacterium]
MTKVTEVKIETTDRQEMAAVILNNNLVIREIKINKGQRSEIVSLIYPEYLSQKGQSIPQIAITDQKLGAEINKAVAELRPSLEKAVDLVYKITKIVPFRVKDSQVKAFVSIIFNNAVRVEVRVMDSPSGLWLAWPGRKTKNGAWIKQFELTSISLKQAVEKAILNKYAVVKSEEP